MRSTRRPLVALLAAVIVTAGAGCGGDVKAKNAYVDDVTTAQRNYVTQFDQVRQRLTATSTAKQDRATLGAFVTATSRFVTRLKHITPPSAVKRQHAKLVATMVGYQGEVQKAARGLASGSTADRARVRTDLSSSVQATQQKLQDAINAINNGLRS